MPSLSPPSFPVLKHFRLFLVCLFLTPQENVNQRLFTLDRVQTKEMMAPKSTTWWSSEFGEVTCKGMGDSEAAAGLESPAQFRGWIIEAACLELPAAQPTAVSSPPATVTAYMAYDHRTLSSLDLVHYLNFPPPSRKECLNWEKTAIQHLVLRDLEFRLLAKVKPG